MKNEHSEEYKKGFHVGYSQGYQKGREKKNKEKLVDLTKIPSIEPVSMSTFWIPIETRPMTEEERRDFAEYWDVDYEMTAQEEVFCGQMPVDGQEILISTTWGSVDKDVCVYDPDEGYSLEDRGDWDGVTAWMPLPEPYKKEGEAK